MLLYDLELKFASYIVQFSSSHFRTYLVGVANAVGVTEDLQQMPGAATYHNWFQVLASK